MVGAKPLLWGIVLAGGEGERLRGFVRDFLGTERPKQFCAFWGQRTMLEHTLRRAESLIPPDRLLVVATAAHRQHVFSCLGIRPPGTVLLQPTGRDTC
ncbi:MAG TPA: NTP transferase domain-containing protein, partial [Nitrospiraceae bacterium]|nr:NTP transferase domain-containing protein [Nitrospiraceae bacterium]